MSAITKEQLRERAREKVKSLEFSITQTAFADSRAELEEELELARIALASLEAEPVGFIARHKETGKFGSYLHPKADWFKNDEYEVLSAYTAPPAPVSVPEWTNEQCMEFLSIAFRHAEINGDLQLDDIRLGVKMVNGSRAAMLQGAENSESPTTIQTAPALDSSPKIAESPSGNSPVIHEGWISVSDQTPDEYDFDIWVFSPSIGVQDGVQWDGLEFADDEYQFRIKDVSHWMKKIYPAAPQKEVK